MMKRIWLLMLLKKDGVGKRVRREAAKNNTYRPNKMRNVQLHSKENRWSEEVFRPKTWDE